MKNSFCRLFFSFLLIFLFPHLAHSRAVTIPVHGLVTATKEPVPIDVEWDEKWFFESQTTTYNHNIARIAVLLSSISYIQPEKNPQDNPMINAYRALGFKDSDIEWNYVLDYSTPIGGNNQAAYSFANKTVQTSEGAKKLVFVVLRGTPLNANEWLSNLNISDSTHKDTQIHEGFTKTITNIHTSLIYYLLKNKISPEESVFLITGHSRGASLANLLGATLEDEGIITGERLFVYTFAAPNVSQEERTADPKYDFIWNIVNAEDIIPTVPPNRKNWNWKKFGHIKVIPNYWNTRKEVYLNDYIPRMNEYYEKLLLRPYSPFKSGPFIQSQIARLLTSLYKTVERYYGKVWGMKGIAEKILTKTFPEDENGVSGPSTEEKELPFIMRIIKRNVNSNIDGGFEYAMNAFVDMHACESYLSWLLALNEGEAFSDLGSTQIVFSGNYDCAVYADDGTLLCKIYDGAIKLYTVKVPIAAFPLPNRCVIGFPGNQNVNVVLHKDSLIPTIVGYRIEHYDAAGTFLRADEKEHLFPYKSHLIRFKAGEETLFRQSLRYEKLTRGESKPLIKQYELKQNIKFKVQPEIGFSTERTLNVGFRTGNQEIFASFLGDFYFRDSRTAYGVSIGIGHQQCLFGNTMLDLEAFSRFVWTREDVEGFKGANFVPTYRISLTYKPRHRIQFFASGVFDLHIKDFNDGAFDSLIREKSLGKIHIGEHVDFYPSLHFGVRF